MHASLKQLLSISSDPIALKDDGEAGHLIDQWNFLGSELVEVLATRNGFWVYESALLVRPIQNTMSPLGIVEWNDHSTWKGDYFIDLTQALFFAEDVFGNQYCFAEGKVRAFDPEIGGFEDVAGSLAEWAEIVMEDYDYRTGYALAHEWQIRSHPLQPGTRLLPKQPFVLGGKYEVDNLYAGDEVEGMVFRASVANQIHDVPEGGQVVIDVIRNSKRP